MISQPIEGIPVLDSPRQLQTPGAGFILTLCAALLVLLLSGCGSDEGGSDRAADAEIAADLNSGPMATESMTLDPGLAAWGAQLFKSKACITCHDVGTRKQGPDLKGVAARRTERWMMKQILDPEWMLKNDPIARGLMAEYALQMANQQVKENEAKALVHYLLKETLAGE